MFDDYNSIYAKYERQQTIEKVPEEEIVKEPDKVLCCTGLLYKEAKKQRKLQQFLIYLVHIIGPCLNECLYAGPYLLEKFFDVLVRFLLNAIGIISDIKQALLDKIYNTP